MSRKVKKILSYSFTLSSISSLFLVNSCIQVPSYRDLRGGGQPSHGGYEKDSENDPEVDKQLLAEGRLYFKENDTNYFLKPNHKYYFKDVVLNEKDYDVDYYYTDKWKELITKPFISSLDAKTLGREKNLVSDWWMTKAQRDKFKAEIEKRDAEYETKRNDPEYQEWMKNEFSIEYLVLGEFFSMIRRFLEGDNKLNNKSMNKQFVQKMIEFLESSNHKYFSEIGYQNENEEYFYKYPEKEKEHYKNKYVRFFKASPYREANDTMTSVHSKDKDRNRAQVHKLWFDNVISTNYDNNIWNNKDFQMGVLPYSFSTNFKIKNRYRNWVANAYDEKYYGYIYNPLDGQKMLETANYGSPNVLDLALYSAAKNYFVEERERQVYLKALKFQLALMKIDEILPSDKSISEYLYAISKGDLTLEKENLNNYESFKIALKEYGKAILDFVGLDTFALNESQIIKDKEKNYVIADLFGYSRTDDFIYTYRFAYNELLNTIMPFYTLTGLSENTELNEVLLVLSDASDSVRKAVYDYAFFYLNYIFEHSPRVKNRNKIARIDTFDYKFNLKTQDSLIAKNKVNTIFEKIKNIYR